MWNPCLYSTWNFEKSSKYFLIIYKGYEGFSVDIWSSGVVLYAMLSGTVPFKANSMNDLHKLILKGQYNEIKEISSGKKKI